VTGSLTRLGAASMTVLAVVAWLGPAAARPAPARPARTVAAPPARTAPAKMRAVVRAWSTRLNAGDNRGVARLFGLPSAAVQGAYAYRFSTRAQIAAWHSGLPCAGRIVSITIRGQFATAVFRLGNRGKTRCDAPGTLAAARFGIVRGKIVLWEQVPVPSGVAA